MLATNDKQWKNLEIRRKAREQSEVHRCSLTRQRNRTVTFPFHSFNAVYFKVKKYQFYFKPSYISFSFKINIHLNITCPIYFPLFSVLFLLFSLLTVNFSEKSRNEELL